MPHKEEMVHCPWREQESVLGEQRVGEKQLKVPVGGLQEKQETMQDAGYRMHEGNENPKFEARNPKKFK
jgi:hypothetical protein